MDSHILRQILFPGSLPSANKAYIAENQHLFLGDGWILHRDLDVPRE
jgi:hypothetical protein